MLHATGDVHLAVQYNTVFMAYFRGDQEVVAPTVGPLRDFYNHQLRKYSALQPGPNKTALREEAEKTLRLLYFKSLMSDVDRAYGTIIRNGFQSEKFIRAMRGEVTATLPYPANTFATNYKFGKQNRKGIGDLYLLLQSFIADDKYGSNTDEFLTLTTLVKGMWMLDGEILSRWLPPHEMIPLRA